MFRQVANAYRTCPCTFHSTQPPAPRHRIVYAVHRVLCIVYCVLYISCFQQNRLEFVLSCIVLQCSVVQSSVLQCNGLYCIVHSIETDPNLCMHIHVHDILEEPTNHLDMEAVVWLEDYLFKWNKILFVVSHSQNFMNRCSCVRQCLVQGVGREEGCVLDEYVHVLCMYVCMGKSVCADLSGITSQRHTDESTRKELSVGRVKRNKFIFSYRQSIELSMRQAFWLCNTVSRRSPKISECQEVA